MQIRVFLVIFLLGQSSVQGMHNPEAGNPDSAKGPYLVKYKIDIPITLIALAGNSLGLLRIQKNTRITDVNEINKLNAENIPKFDRGSLTLDASYLDQANTISNWGLNVSIALPALLLLNKEIRADWLPIMLLYMESELVFANVYAWGAAQFVTRYRPFLYLPDVAVEKKLGDFRKNSFFSGHTSSTATASFFMASVYATYHKTANKLLLYSLASLPPAFVGFFRYKAGKHFPSDVLTGFAVGAVGGMLIPYLHRLGKGERKNSLTIQPVLGPIPGVRAIFRV